MHMMRRLKSIASGRSSVSDQGGDSGSKRPKFDQDGAGDIVIEPHLTDNKPMSVDHESSSSHRDAEASTSTSVNPARTEETGADLLPKEMNDMTISDDKVDGHNDKETEGVIVDGNGTETGQIIVTTIGGQNGKPKQKVSYMAERVVGTGSFGVVFQAKCLESGETVAIKKVLQDKRYKNRELQTMQLLDHPNVVQLKHHFFSTTERGEVYLNLVLEYVSETVYRVAKDYNQMNHRVPILYVKLYTYQMCRALAYIHRVGVCHRDIKPQNLLVNPHTHQLKLCDFGSAKKLVPGEPNISYICSRYYRAPELIFGATEYTTAIDIWSVGCVLAELLIGQPLFPGESDVDQLVKIIKILGTPTREEIRCMNPNYSEFKFPQIKARPWHKLFGKRMPPEAVDLVSRLLQYSPNLRFTAVDACAHPFFDELRDPKTCLPNGRPLPPLFNFATAASDGEDHAAPPLPTTIESPPSYFDCLPNDFIRLVAYHLKSSRLDVEHMRQTCRAWRMAIPGIMGSWIVLSRRDPMAEARHTMLEISKGVEAADASLQRKEILTCPPVGASCFGSAQGLLGMRWDQPRSRQSFLFCLLCGSCPPLIIFPEGMAPRSIYFWPAHEHSHFIVMMMDADSDSMLFSDTLDWGGDWETGINWRPYPGTEGHLVRSVAFYPGLFTAMATKASMVILDEHSRLLIRPEDLLFLRAPAPAPVLDAEDPLLAWDQNGHHVFFCDQKLYLCVLVDSPTAAEGVVTWLFVMEKDEDMGYMLLPTKSIGQYSVYLGPNQAIVLPACDPFIGSLSNTVYVEDYRGLTRRPKVLAINLGTQVVISIPYPGDITSVDEFLPAVWVCPPQYKDTFGHCGRR